MSKLVMETEGDTVIVVRRRFDASPEDVFEAHMNPELIQQWMLGPEGWTMPECEHEAKVGGKFKFVWSNGEASFFLTGEYLEIDPPQRIVHVERMHLPDPTPENRVETTFTADGEGTLLVVRMTVPDAATRKAMLENGMEHGMEASYARLEKL